MVSHVQSACKISTRVFRRAVLRLSKETVTHCLLMILCAIALEVIIANTMRDSHLWHPHPYDPDEKDSKSRCEVFPTEWGWEGSAYSQAQCLQKKPPKKVQKEQLINILQRWGRLTRRRSDEKKNPECKNSLQEIQRLNTFMDFAIVDFCRVRPVESLPVEPQVKV